MGAARRLADYRDLLDLPDHVVGEILNGQLEVSPRPRFAHARASSRLDRWLGDFDDGGDDEPPEQWWIFPEVEVLVGNDVLVPDLAGWRRSRCPEMPSGRHAEQAPDWVCEVLSPGSVRMDRQVKLPLYAQAGVGHAWLVDVDERLLEAYRREGTAWLLLGVWSGTDVARIAPFDARELQLARLWAPTGAA